jgi:hypothetical protein
MRVVETPESGRFYKAAVPLPATTRIVRWADCLPARPRVRGVSAAPRRSSNEQCSARSRSIRPGRSLQAQSVRARARLCQRRAGPQPALAGAAVELAQTLLREKLPVPLHVDKQRFAALRAANPKASEDLLRAMCAVQINCFTIAADHGRAPTLAIHPYLSLLVRCARAG